MSETTETYIETCEWLITDLREQADFFDDLDDPHREEMLPVLTTLRTHADVLTALVADLKQEIGNE